LHAKIYLADNFILAGSANPSTNGLGFEGPETAGLIESCVASNDIAIVDSWKRFFEERIKPKARNLSDDDLSRAKILYNKLKSIQRQKRQETGAWNPGSSACDWTTTLDVVNCAKYADDVIRNEAYVCPPKGNAFQHRRSRYFGLYRNKKVEMISEIDAVIDIGPTNSLESATVKTPLKLRISSSRTLPLLKGRSVLYKTLSQTENCDGGEEFFCSEKCSLHPSKKMTKEDCFLARYILTSPRSKRKMPRDLQ
jgi:hypothetical protein